jgi:hypothetical protein
MSALVPEHKDHQDWDSREHSEPLVVVHPDSSPEPEGVLRSTIEEDVGVATTPKLVRQDTAADRDSDPVWTWNTPDYITGDRYRIGSVADKEPSKDVQANQQRLAEKIAGLPRTAEQELTLKEKVENLRCYFGSNEELEKEKGGRTHYRLVLSFDVPATNSQIRELTNEFLGQTFPKAKAFAAIHRDTNHPHVHIYIHSRQIDGKRINLKSRDYRTIDEKWSQLYSVFAGDRGIHAEHLRKKEETREWKRAAAMAYQKGEKIPPKPERDSDRRERLAEQRLSGQRSAVIDRGELPGPRPPAEPVMRPRSERETGRMIAMEHVARERLAHLIRTDAPYREIDLAARTALGLRDGLDKTVAAREQMGKSKLPAPAYTIGEGRLLAEYHRSRDAHDGRASESRLVAQEKIAGAELMNAQRKAEAFESRRHLWKFELEGQDNKLSLRDIERAIEQKQAERLQVFNFIRPSRRDAIDSQLSYLADLKKEIQEKLSARAESIVRAFKAAELRDEVTAKQLEARIGGTTVPADRPRPSYTQAEMERLFRVANSNRDSQLLWHVHQVTVDRVPVSPELAGVMVGRALMARMEMLRAYDRTQATHKYQAFRQVPLRDAQGQDHTKSLRQVEPRTAAEAAVIDQVNLADREFGRSKDYLEVRVRMANDYCKAAGVRPTEMAPILNEHQIREIKEYAGKLAPFSSHRREFERAIPLAERALREREVERSRVVREMLGISVEKGPEPREARSRVGPAHTQPDRPSAPTSRCQGPSAPHHAPKASAPATIQSGDHLFQIDRSDPRQRAGIARGEQMVRTVEYSRMMMEAPHSRQIGLMLEHSKQAIGLVEAYKVQTGRDPAPILTTEQRDLLTSNQNLLDSRARQELQQALERAVVHLESGRDTPLDQTMPNHPAEQTRDNQQKQSLDRGDSFRGR